MTIAWEPTLFVFGFIFLLIMLGIPVTAALGLVGIGAAFLFLGTQGVAGYVSWQVCDSFILTAVPLFVFMGEVLLKSGATDRLYDGCAAIIGKIPGGLLHANIIACAIFAAISGSSVATAATIGTIAIPELEKRGYDMKLVLGSLAAGGTLGILIPPSIAFIIYAVFTENSIGELFMAGVVPGIMLAIMFMIYIFFRVLADRSLAPKYQPITGAKRFLNVLQMWPIFIIMFIVLGGIYLGVMTPTEAAAAGAMVAVVFSILNKRMTWSILQNCALSTVKTSTMVMFIIISASIVAGTLGLLRIPSQISTWVVSMGLSPLMILICIYIMYLFLGCFFEGTSMIVLTMPIIYPVIIALGYDPIWFGVALVILIEMAALTPPVGLNLFTIHGLRPNHPVSEVIEGSLPFVVIQVIALSVLTAFPQIALWLPNSMK